MKNYRSPFLMSLALLLLGCASQEDSLKVDPRFEGYYKSMRQKVDSAWVKAFKRADVKLLKKELANKKLKAATVVSLDAKGNILDIALTTKSGNEFVDSTAVAAVKSSGPFDPPPAELLDQNGSTKIRWDFVVAP
ncbi:MAG: TonB C-terminal domain-containing protein [Bdellovibrionota bacterium]